MGEGSSVVGDAVSIACDAVSMVDVLSARAGLQGDRVAYTFLEDGETDARPLTYAMLDRWSRAVAVTLAEQASRGDRVLLLFPSGLDYIAAFFGCLYAGMVAVPIYPPRIGTRFESRDLVRTQAIAADAGSALVLTTALVRDLAVALLPQLPELAGVPWVATDELVGGLDAADDWSHPNTGRDDLAVFDRKSAV